MFTRKERNHDGHSSGGQPGKYFGKSAKRALRRQALARQKRRARQIYPHDKKARAANHLKTCSCPMCGNPRRWFGERPIAEDEEERASEAARFAEAELA